MDVRGQANACALLPVSVLLSSLRRADGEVLSNVKRLCLLLRTSAELRMDDADKLFRCDCDRQVSPSDFNLRAAHSFRHCPIGRRVEISINTRKQPG